MAVDLAASSPAFRLTRALAVPARVALGGLVLVSFALRFLAALAHSTPLYFPDEYIHDALSRSLADTGKLAIRGAPAHFPALLQPLLAAPFWLTHDAELSYRLTQGLNALAMSLAAIPVYLLVRRLGLGSGVGLGCAAIAVASPDLLYASFVLSDPIAYPLVLTAVYLAVRALERPTLRIQVAFMAASGLASFARVQYVVLPVAFAGAALAVERGRVKRFWPTFAMLAAPIPLVFAVGTDRVLGYYSQVGHAHVPLGAALKWASIDTMMLAYSAGWLLVPGALVGLAYALVRPRTRVEHAFGAFVVLLADGVFSRQRSTRRAARLATRSATSSRYFRS